MKANEVIQVLLYFGLLIGLTPPIGRFMARVFGGERTFLTPILGQVERWVYRLGIVDPKEEMSWKRYFAAVLLFNVVGLLSLWVDANDPGVVPLNPQHFPNVPWALA